MKAQPRAMQHFNPIVLAPLLGVLLTSCASPEGYPSSPAAPAQGQVSAYVDIRSGPAEAYPLVGRLPPGVGLSVLGCLQDYLWCDVTAQGLRGWVYGGYLQYPYQGRPATVLSHGATIGLPIITFSFSQYWDTHYARQPWYRERQHWIHQQQPPRTNPATPWPPRALPPPPRPEPFPAPRPAWPDHAAEPRPAQPMAQQPAPSTPPPSTTWPAPPRSGESIKPPQSPSERPPFIGRPGQRPEPAAVQEPRKDRRDRPRLLDDDSEAPHRNRPDGR